MFISGIEIIEIIAKPRPAIDCLLFRKSEPHIYRYHYTSHLHNFHDSQIWSFLSTTQIHTQLNYGINSI